MWPLSKRARKDKYPGLRSDPSALILNVGAGTTGTRFLDCVVSKLGASTGHNIDHPHVDKNLCKEASYSYQEPGPNDLPPYDKSCTAAWDKFNYASDSPVPYELAGILAR